MVATKGRPRPVTGMGHSAPHFHFLGGLDADALRARPPVRCGCMTHLGHQRCPLPTPLVAGPRGVPGRDTDAPPPTPLSLPGGGPSWALLPAAYRLPTVLLARPQRPDRALKVGVGGATQDPPTGGGHARPPRHLRLRSLPGFP